VQKEDLRESSQQSETKIQRIIELYQSGLSMREVGLEFGVTRQRVQQILKDAGVETRNYTKSNRFFEVRKEKRKVVPKELLIKYYQDQSLSVREVIEKLGTNSVLLYKSLKFHNIPKRIEESSKNSPLTREVLRRLYLEEGLTSSEIASRLGYSRFTIRNKLSQYGIRKSDNPN
jgi:predicted DNA-binding protein YlxM (UPF0122 family)